MTPKMRDLTDKELADLKPRRDQNLDALSSIAVAESTEADPAAARAEVPDDWSLSQG
jgi:hypothetical protein